MEQDMLREQTLVQMVTEHQRMLLRIPSGQGAP